MTMMYSPLGGWSDVTPGDVEDMRKKGWYTEDNENYLHPTRELVKAAEKTIMEAQAVAVRRVGRPRKDS